MSPTNPLLSLAILALLASASATSQPTTPEQGQEEAPWYLVFRQIYNTDKETATLTPTETLELFKQLQNLILEDPQKQFDPNEMDFVIQRINAMIDASEVNESQCTSKHFEDMSTTYSATSELYCNVLNYLQQFIEDQIVLCSSKQTAALVNADDQFSQEELDDIAYLVRQDKFHKKINAASRIDGLLDLMENKYGKIRGQRAFGDKEKFVKLYTNGPQKLCKKVVDHLEPIVDIYKEVEVDQVKNLQNKISKLTLTWINNYQVCRDLLIDMNRLIDSPSRALVSLVSKPKRSA